MTTITATDFNFLAQFVQQHSAIVLEPGKEYLVTGRLAPVLQTHNLDGYSALVTALRRTPRGPMKDDVIEAMTTNETSFFRDRTPFEALKDAVIPDIVASRTLGRTLNVWCAACSSGQEPYSVAITARDALRSHPQWEVRIHCTDINKAMVDRTVAGKFSALEANRGMPITTLVANFDQTGRDWVAKRELRDLITARTMNLDEPFPSMPRMDVVFLRNVLIYFDLPTKEKVLARVAQTMSPGGYLFLGAAETTLGLNTPFERVMVGRAPVYRLKGTSR